MNNPKGWDGSNIIFRDDCRDTIQGFKGKFDYVITSPPDFDELGWDPMDDWHRWLNFLTEVFNPLSDTTITIVVTDRKYKGMILEKHSAIIDLFVKDLDMNVISHKIWVKSFKQNLYRLNYSHMITFRKHGVKGVNHHNSDYEVDVYNIPNEKFMGYPYAFPLLLPTIMIRNFTEPDQLVYDPFLGSGTTVMAALEQGRRYIGSEINQEYVDIANERLTLLRNKLRLH